MNPLGILLTEAIADEMLLTSWRGTVKLYLVTPDYVFDRVTPVFPTVAQTIKTITLTGIVYAEGIAEADNAYVTNLAPKLLIGGGFLSRTLLGQPEAPFAFLPFSQTEEPWITPGYPFWIVWQDNGVFAL